MCRQLIVSFFHVCIMDRGMLIVVKVPFLYAWNAGGFSPQNLVPCTCWYMPAVSLLQRQRQENPKFKVIHGKNIEFKDNENGMSFCLQKYFVVFHVWIMLRNQVCTEGNVRETGLNKIKETADDW